VRTRSRLKKSLNPAWIEEALTWGHVLDPAPSPTSEQVVWLVIGMALYRRAPIERVVQLLDLAVPDGKWTLLAKSAVTQARQRLKHDALEYLFAVTASRWAAQSADRHRWRGLALHGWDGTTQGCKGQNEQLPAEAALDEEVAT
jgi:hypothetical protein